MRSPDTASSLAHFPSIIGAQRPRCRAALLLLLPPKETPRHCVATQSPHTTERRRLLFFTILTFHCTHIGLFFKANRK